MHKLVHLGFSNSDSFAGKYVHYQLILKVTFCIWKMKNTIMILKNLTSLQQQSPHRIPPSLYSQDLSSDHNLDQTYDHPSLGYPHHQKSCRFWCGWTWWMPTSFLKRPSCVHVPGKQQQSLPWNRTF